MPQLGKSYHDPFRNVAFAGRLQLTTPSCSSGDRKARDLRCFIAQVKKVRLPKAFWNGSDSHEIFIRIFGCGNSWSCIPKWAGLSARCSDTQGDAVLPPGAFGSDAVVRGGGPCAGAIQQLS